MRQMWGEPIMNRRRMITGAVAALLLAGAGTMGWRSATGTMEQYRAYGARLRAPLSPDPQIPELIRYASLAASSHNTQPWRFRVSQGRIDITPDFTCQTPVVDPDDHHLFVSLGCAAENLRIAATTRGWPGTFFAGPEGLRYDFTSANARPDPLLAAIPERQSSRSDYDGRSLLNAELTRLTQAATLPGVRCVMLTERRLIGQLRDLVVRANDAQMTNPAFRAELKSWIRFNPRSAMRHGDGLFAASTGNPILPDLFGGPAFDTFVSPSAENDKSARQIDSSAGVVIFLAETEGPEGWMAVGRACQRFALAATSLGVKQAFINQPLEVARFRPELAALIGEPGLRPDIILRFVYGPAMPFSARRPVEAVVDYA